MKFLSRFFKPKETVTERRAKRKCCSEWDESKGELPPTHSHEEDWAYIKNEKKELEK